MDSFDASVSSVKAPSSLGIAKTGGEVRAALSASKDCCASVDHSNLRFFWSKTLSGPANFEKSRTNLL